MARMKIDTGSITSENINTVTQEVGASALSDLLNEVVAFYKINEESKEVKARLDSKKSSIIELMQKLDLKEIKHKNVKCTLAERTNTSVNDEALLEFCKQLTGEDGLVKTVEMVDMDVLENLIYTGKIEKTLIEPFFTKTVSKYPKISGKLME